VTDPAAPAAARSGGRFIDRGAIFAGWVGIGMAVVVAIGFELILAIQTLVFIWAPIGGILIGAYANVRSERRRPIPRVFLNALYAALVSGLSLALIYGGLRLLFVYADTGYRIAAEGGQLACETGPECTWMRYVEAGYGDELAAEGVTDGGSFGAYIVGDVVRSGGVIILLTVGGAMAAAAGRSLRPVPPGEGQRRVSSAA